ncbi:MAG: 3-dehydroquinate synthase [Actinobacteria bacterium]|nr:3-dehydroquinate synthase [Actinomycetota bacterium]MCI0543276.1 3-dehydroquinate synthase [Actinomycetota bacterium]MCI0678037.1 3-dehydroquinate synthase [Actinomycetota bacterium]
MDRLIVADHTEVIVGEGWPRPLLPPREDRRQVALLTQPEPTSRAIELAGLLREDGLRTEVIGLPDRDEAKTLEVAATVYQALAGSRLTAQDTIIGFGGGAVTDLAGFVAGTWMRGVEAVHFPTTFLAAIDAAIGGKTGVNIGGKNLVGLFWHPTRVVIDLNVLETLPPELVREGMAEAYKAGLVGDPALAALLSDDPEPDTREVVLRALLVKKRLVDLDPRDRGERAFLNFGHTIGHALEYASTLSHGESVALGMVAAARVSEMVAGFPDRRTVTSTIERLGLPTTVPGVDGARVRDLVGRDKKRDHSGTRMVLLKEIGDPFLTHVGPDEVEAGLSAIGL